MPTWMVNGLLAMLFALAVSLQGCTAAQVMKFNAGADKVFLAACDGVELAHQGFYMGESLILSGYDMIKDLLMKIGLLKPDPPPSSGLSAAVEAPPLCQRVPTTAIKQ